MGQRRLEYMPLDVIQRAPRNPKRHDTAGIKASVDHFGVAELPLLDDRTGRLVAGHGRLEDLQTRVDSGEGPPEGIEVADDGTWLVPVIRGWSSRSDADAEAYLVASNQLTAKAGWDHQGIAEMLADLNAVDPVLAALTGFSADELDDLARAQEVPDLDHLADSLKPPGESDGWPTIRFKVPHHISAAWEGHLDTHGDDEVMAFAALLGVDPLPPKLPDWEPDLQAGRFDEDA